MDAITGVEVPIMRENNMIVVSASMILCRGTYRHIFHPTV